MPRHPSAEPRERRYIRRPATEESMQSGLSGRTIVVTGGFGVLGRAVAEMAVARGARVALVDFAPVPRGYEINAERIGQVDLSEPAEAEQAMARAAEVLGGVDALLNIAGGFVWQTVSDGDPGAWDKMFRLNLKTNLAATRAALPYLVQGSDPAIVNVGANGALKAAAGMGAYAASKAGVHKLTESLAEELKGKVRVNAVLPSIIDTAQNRADMPDVDPTLWVQASELAETILFLASPAASAITGALVPVTGRV
jgi:NAD(P)-dependent dehydrogenase (short-subunit alcohol dehydrogenase family)